MFSIHLKFVILCFLHAYDDTELDIPIFLSRFIIVLLFNSDRISFSDHNHSLLSKC